MEVKIQGFVGIHKVAFTAEGVTLLVGKNAAGKSSTALAIAAAVTGEMTPIPGIRKNAATYFVNRRASQASVEIKSSEGIIIATWPDCKYTTDGNPISADFTAAGIEKISAMSSQRERASYLSRYLFAMPVREEFVEALEGLDPQRIDKVWEEIQVNRDWDITHSKYMDVGKRHKGEWASVAGEPFGIKKAESWFPPSWEDSMDAMSEETLLGALTQERENLEALISSEAVSKSEAERLKGIIAKKTVLDQTIPGRIQDFENELQALLAKRPSMPPSNPMQSRHDCPHCGKAISIGTLHHGGYSVSVYEDISKEESSKRLKDISTIDGRIGFLNGEIQRLKHNRQQEEFQISQSLKAEEELAKLGPVSDGQNSKAIEAARNQIRLSENRFSAWKTKRTADHHFKEILAVSQIVKALAADGVRAWKLKKSIDAFNAKLAELSTLANWGKVSIGTDFLPFFVTPNGEFPFGALSTSEQFRTNVTIQAAITSMGASRVMIVDGAEVLDKDGRRGLFRILTRMKKTIKPIVCMTVTEPDKDPPPDLSKLKIGKTVWIQDGESHPNN